MNKFAEYKDIIDNEIANLLNCSDRDYSLVYNAAKYSLEIGGKRIRPALFLEFVTLFDLDYRNYLDVALAIEMVHTYSLIHDDLPCMDNDDFRRGKPSCHKKFSEDIALLAGDGLLTHSFGQIASNAYLSADNKVRCISLLSEYAGMSGMIGGQVIDLTNRDNSIESIIKLNELKTSRLLQLSCTMGVIVANGSEDDIQKANDYGYYLGLAFQIVDDILDVVGNEETLGKPVNSDIKNDKNNFVSLLGIEKAKEYAKLYTDKAIEALEHFDDKANDIIDFTNKLLNRNF